MSTLAVPLSPRRPLAAPTRAERVLLRLSHAVEASLLRRIARRSEAATLAPAQDRAADVRRTAQALGAVGMLPR